jgi:hypothetical protein
MVYGTDLSGPAVIHSHTHTVPTAVLCVNNAYMQTTFQLLRSYSACVRISPIRQQLSYSKHWHSFLILSTVIAL